MKNIDESEKFRIQHEQNIQAFMIYSVLGIIIALPILYYLSTPSEIISEDINSIFEEVNSAYPYFIKLIIKGNIVVFVIIISSFIVEKITGLKLIIDNFKWKKSTRNVEASATFNSFSYFLTNLGVLIYEYYKDRIELSVLLIITWLLFVVLLSYIVYKIDIKYQGHDPQKADDNYT